MLSGLALQTCLSQSTSIFGSNPITSHLEVYLQVIFFKRLMQSSRLQLSSWSPDYLIDNSKPNYKVFYSRFWFNLQTCQHNDRFSLLQFSTAFFFCFAKWHWEEDEEEVLPIGGFFNFVRLGFFLAINETKKAAREIFQNSQKKIRHSRTH